MAFACPLDLSVVHYLKGWTDVFRCGVLCKDLIQWYVKEDALPLLNSDLRQEKLPQPCPHLPHVAHMSSAGTCIKIPGYRESPGMSPGSRLGSPGSGSETPGRSPGTNLCSPGRVPEDSSREAPRIPRVAIPNFPGNVPDFPAMLESLCDSACLQMIAGG